MIACCVCEIEVHEPGVNAMAVPEVSEKQKKSNDQRAPAIRYYLIKEPGH